MEQCENLQPWVQVLFYMYMCFQILWNEDEDGCVDDVTELNAPLVPHYHRRFTVHFEKSAAGWEPTIVCYIPKEKKLQVCYHVKIQRIISQVLELR